MKSSAETIASHQLKLSWHLLVGRGNTYEPSCYWLPLELLQLPDSLLI